MTTQLLTPIRTDTSNAFANRTIRERIPTIIRETQQLNPDYPATIQKTLDDLHDALVNDAPISMIEQPAPDYDDWLMSYGPHEGETWQGTSWFFAELYFYRQLIQAVRWWETGRDPFAPKKAEEYASDTLWQLLDSALAVDGKPENRLATLIEFALWGNRIDLSYALAASHGNEIQEEDLLVDERERVIEHLMRQRGTVHIIADNAGSEVTMDLVLAAALLEEAVADEVVLHLKLHPTFVSDATVADINAFIEQIVRGQHGLAAQHFGESLQTQFIAGRLRLAPDAYWNSSRFLRDLPPRLAQIFHGSSLAIIKGDANYRRMVDDIIWPADTPMAEMVDYFPCPLLALRTLKSDPVIGLPGGMAEDLDKIDNQWRVNGRRGILQTTLSGNGA